MDLATLNSTANELVKPGKGILAADESTGTIEKRFKAIGVESTETNRRDYRELMFRAPDAEKHISGVILYDETIRQKAADGTPLVKLLASRGIIAGIKVDKGAVAMPGSPKEKFTLGIDGLRERLAEYKVLGARFAKWRGVIEIDDALPTEGCIAENAHSLALDHTWNIADDKVNQLRFGYTRRGFSRESMRGDVPASAASGIPNIPNSTLGNTFPSVDVVGFQQLGPTSSGG